MKALLASLVLFLSSEALTVSASKDMSHLFPSPPSPKPSASPSTSPTTSRKGHSSASTSGTTHGSGGSLSTSSETTAEMGSGKKVKKRKSIFGEKSKLLHQRFVEFCIGFLGSESGKKARKKKAATEPVVTTPQTAPAKSPCPESTPAPKTPGKVSFPEWTFSPETKWKGSPSEAPSVPEKPAKAPSTKTTESKSGGHGGSVDQKTMEGWLASIQETKWKGSPSEAPSVPEKPAKAPSTKTTESKSGGHGGSVDQKTMEGWLSSKFDDDDDEDGSRF